MPYCIKKNAKINQKFSPSAERMLGFLSFRMRVFEGMGNRPFEKRYVFIPLETGS